MPSKHSAGILLFRRREDAVQVLLGHSGGPFFARKSTHAWSLPKGEIEVDEDPWEAARREFLEELGVLVPSGDRLSLGDIVQRNGKRVTAWAIEADLDPATVTPGTFEMEWPRGSGRIQEFPELDRVQWFGTEEARTLMFVGQDVLLDRLETLLS
jgi:predicted NUDIX family NTP pyrophosphohydrolase